jgi:hypothetical protein
VASPGSANRAARSYTDHDAPGPWNEDDDEDDDEEEDDDDDDEEKTDESKCGSSAAEEPATCCRGGSLPVPPKSWNHSPPRTRTGLPGGEECKRSGRARPGLVRLGLNEIGRSVAAR